MEKIIEHYENLNLLEAISSNSKNTIDINYDINIFNDEIENNIILIIK